MKLKALFLLLTFVSPLFGGKELTVINKFGQNREVGTSAYEDIWERGGTYTFPTTAQAIWASGASSCVSCTNTYTIQGLDGNWDLQDVDVTIQGQTKTAVTGLTWMRVFRVFNSGSAENSDSIYVYSASNVSSGRPDTDAAVLALILPEHEQTHMAIMTIPRNARGFMKNLMSSINRETSATKREATFELMRRDSGGVFREQRTWGLQTEGNGIFNDPLGENYPGPNGFSGMTDVKVKAQAVGAISDITTSFQMEIEDLR